MNKESSVAAWVALSLALGARSARLKPLLAHFHTPEAVLAATDGEVLSVLPHIGKGALSALCFQRQEKEVARILSYCRQRGVKVLTPDMAEYPASLFAISEPPAVLYCLGDLSRLGKAPLVGVVGARENDAYGARMAYKLSFELAASGAVVVSGLADGIDGIAAAAAIDAGATTVGVLGCGIDRVYPKHHARLYSEVAECGVILTEYAPGTGPLGWNFPARNRLISALSEALVVVEANERSGALITARYALLQGKPLFAVPGDADNPRSAGCNMLLRAGALMATTGEDVLSHFRFLYRDALDMRVPPEALQYTGVTQEKLKVHGVHLTNESKKAGKDRAEGTQLGARTTRKNEEQQSSTAASPTSEALASLSERDRKVYEALPDTPFTVDVLVAKGFAPREAVAAMTLFEILSLVRSTPGGTYQKTAIF